ncbi:MAG: zinc-ribbon domain-containing protein [Promethearchaeota archaeon]
MSDKKNENELRADNSWKKRIKKPDLKEQESELHETEPFVAVKLNDLETEPYKKLHVSDLETPAFVDVKINNSQSSERICRKCGYHVKEENMNFCPKCGNRLKSITYNFRR